MSINIYVPLHQSREAAQKPCFLFLCLQPVHFYFCCPPGLNSLSFLPNSICVYSAYVSSNPPPAAFLCHPITQMQLPVVLCKSKFYFVWLTLVLDTQYVIIGFILYSQHCFENALCTYWAILCTANIVFEYIACTNQVPLAPFWTWFINVRDLAFHYYPNPGIRAPDLVKTFLKWAWKLIAKIFTQHVCEREILVYVPVAYRMYCAKQL